MGFLGFLVCVHSESDRVKSLIRQSTPLESNSILLVLAGSPLGGSLIGGSLTGGSLVAGLAAGAVAGCSVFGCAGCALGAACPMDASRLRAKPAKAPFGYCDK